MAIKRRQFCHDWSKHAMLITLYGMECNEQYKNHRFALKKSFRQLKTESDKLLILQQLILTVVQQFQREIRINFNDI